MTLTFPTLAEQAITLFKTNRTTFSLSAAAKTLGAEVSFEYPFTTYTFEDDSSLVVQGRGRSHKYEAYLP